jgi:hypothetical protein
MVRPVPNVRADPRAVRPRAGRKGGRPEARHRGAPAAGARFGIQAIPTLVAFRDGREVERVSGALPLDELRRFASSAAHVVAG